MLGGWHIGICWWRTFRSHPCCISDNQKIAKGLDSDYKTGIMQNMQEQESKKNIDPATKRFRYLLGFLTLSAPFLGYGFLQLAQDYPVEAASVGILALVASVNMLALGRK